MKMYDCAKKDNYDMPMGEMAKKKKVHYPELLLEKKIANLEMDEDITLVIKATVSGMRSDEYGDTTTFKVKKVGMKNTMTAKDKIGNVVDKMDLS